MRRASSGKRVPTSSAARLTWRTIACNAARTVAGWPAGVAAGVLSVLAAGLPAFVGYMGEVATFARGFAILGGATAVLGVSALFVRFYEQ